MKTKDVFVKLDKKQAEERGSSLFSEVKGVLEGYHEVKESIVNGIYVVKALNVSFLNVPPYLQEELDKPAGIIKLISKEEYISLLPVDTEEIIDMNYKIGDIVPYRNTRGNIKHAEITSFQTVHNGKIWFNGIDTVTKAKVWYPVHISEKLVER